MCKNCKRIDMLVIKGRVYEKNKSLKGQNATDDHSGKPDCDGESAWAPVTPKSLFSN